LLLSSWQARPGRLASSVCSAARISESRGASQLSSRLSKWRRCSGGGLALRLLLPGCVLLRLPLRPLLPGRLWRSLLPLLALLLLCLRAGMPLRLLLWLLPRLLRLRLRLRCLLALLDLLRPLPADMGCTCWCCACWCCSLLLRAWCVALDRPPAAAAAASATGACTAAAAGLMC
jgi:hypothetical protein